MRVKGVDILIENVTAVVQDDITNLPFSEGIYWKGCLKKAADPHHPGHAHISVLPLERFYSKLFCMHGQNLISWFASHLAANKSFLLQPIRLILNSPTL